MGYSVVCVWIRVMGSSQSQSAVSWSTYFIPNDLYDTENFAKHGNMTYLNKTLIESFSANALSVLFILYGFRTPDRISCYLTITTFYYFLKLRQPCFFRLQCVTYISWVDLTTYKLPRIDSSWQHLKRPFEFINR